MFAHQVIESMVAYSDIEGNFSANEILKSLLKSHSFHFEESVLKEVFMSDQKNIRQLFMDRGSFLKLPYQYCWFDCSTCDYVPDIKKYGMLAYQPDKKKDDFLRVIYFAQNQSKQWVPLGESYISVGRPFSDDEKDIMNTEAVNEPIKESKAEYGGPLTEPLKKRFDEDKLNTSIGVYYHEHYEQIGPFLHYSMIHLEYVLSLLNCKNIVTEDNLPPEKLNKKRRQLGRQELFTYKTLKVILPSQSRSSSASSKTNMHQRIHLCRGHFKEYAAENPLFGKHTGLYWWQPHVRGQNKDGIVMKDYDVKKRADS
jgi:hypothetical protein